MTGLVACVQPPYHHPLPEPANIPASFDKTWAAVVDHFASGSIPIRTIEKASGLIVAEVLYVSDEMSRRYADCGSSAFGPMVASRATYNVRVTGDSTVSLVRVNTVFANNVTQCVSTGAFERELMDAIRSMAAPPRPPPPEKQRNGWQ